MSSNDSKFVVEPTDLHMDADGKLFHYFSDALDSPDQVKMREWAYDLLDNKTAQETNVSILVDLPKMVEGMLDGGYAQAMPDGSFLADPGIKPAFDGVKRQLEEALALLNRLQYITDTSTTEL